MRLIAIFRDWLSKSSFHVNIYKMVSGTTSAQFIQLLAVPILSRIYNPADFGVYALFTALSGLLAVLATGRYEIAIFIPTDNEEALHIALLSIIVSILSSILVMLLLLIVRKPLVTIFEIPYLSNLFIGASVLLMAMIGIHQSFVCWLGRKKEYKLISINLILRVILCNLAAILLSMQVIIPCGLIIGNVIGQFIATASLCLVSKNDILKHISGFDIQKIRYISHKYKYFAFFSVPSEFARSLILAIPTWIIGALFGHDILGNYSQVQRVLYAPLSTAGYAVADVYRQQAAADWNVYGNCSKIYIELFKLVLVIFTPIYLLIWLFAPEIIPLILGKQWGLAGAFSRILVPLAFLSFLAAIFGRTTTIANKLREDAIWQIVILIVVTASLLLSSHLGDIGTVLTIFVLSSSLIYLGYLRKCYIYSKGI